MLWLYSNTAIVTFVTMIYVAAQGLLLFCVYPLNESIDSNVLSSDIGNSAHMLV